MAGLSVAVIGAGGNIGSHVVPHLGRLRDLGFVTLVDPGKYERKNLGGQDIVPEHVGKPKALVQSRRLRHLNPRLRVEHITEAVENVPLGRLRADVILSCLDSRLARQYVNEFAWRLAIPWIDAAVQADGLLARVNSYMPKPENPCLECSWAQDDYSALEQQHPCLGDNDPPPTNAPSMLGAVAAALQVIECQKLLTGNLKQSLVGRQVMIDAAWHKHYVSSSQCNPECRFDHQSWQLEHLECRLEEFTLRDTLRLGSPLSLDGKPFVRRLLCPKCGFSTNRLRLGCSIPRAQRVCRKCERQLVAAGFDVLERLDGSLPPEVLALSLARLGLRQGDVVMVGSAHYEIHCERM